MQMQHPADFFSTYPYDASCPWLFTEAFPAYWTSISNATLTTYTSDDYGYLLAAGGTDAGFSPLGAAGFKAASDTGLRFASSHGQAEEEMSSTCFPQTSLGGLPEIEVGFPTSFEQLSLEGLEQEERPSPTEDSTIPTPAALVTFLGHESRFEHNSFQLACTPPPGLTLVAGHATTTTSRGDHSLSPSRPKEAYVNNQSSDSPQTVAATVTRRPNKRRLTGNAPIPATSSSSKDKETVKKRRPRAPPPLQWVPPTLQHFNLQSDDSRRVPSVPLPPVRRNLPEEERDSWDENMGLTPYHPCHLATNAHPASSLAHARHRWALSFAATTLPSPYADAAHASSPFPPLLAKTSQRGLWTPSQRIALLLFPDKVCVYFEVKPTG
ncbi:hypothetical protein CVT26_004155 [Gymnopilus dilepis]|uniref:Uncharacterized protein n=1 Tax=Gymnopilus dilepis TaxID=231916 RepID=A0A409WY93_9AGAR|nr:hypothetical protein CVT26_004155 [Gymnopilus dilepis]